MKNEKISETTVNEAVEYFNKQGNQPVYPQSVRFTDGEVDFYGVNKREYFAAMAMQGLLHTYNGQLPVNEISGAFAMESAIMADALLAELEKTKQQEQ
jgi:hypothetical protein